jgi:AcrR family transcriptional regulator
MYVDAKGLAVTQRRTNKERSRLTQDKLLSAARRLFDERGYAGTAIDDIADAAGVTRGAVYHHFGGKQQLFRAIIEEIQDELAEHVDRNADKYDNPWDAFVGGWLSALEEIPTGGTGRLLMLEGPSVLGYHDWQSIDDAHYQDTVTLAVDYFMSEGIITPQPIEPVVRVLLTVSNALLTLISTSDEPEETRAAIAPVWAQLLQGLRVAPPRR